MNYADILRNISRIARQAGIIALQYYEKPIEQSTKANEYDIVTQADKEAEVFIVGELLKHYPDHHIIGEEGGGMGADINTAEYLWHIDPIDGTANFANGIPIYAVSIALSDKNHVPLVGVVYDPSRDELFAGYRGGGGTVNDKPLRVSTKQSLGQSIVSSGFPTARQTHTATNIVHWNAMVPRTRGVRRIGSAAIELAWVAAGRLDGFWERGLNTWDVMAGLLLIEEAGGCISNYNGESSFQIYGEGEFLVSNGQIHQEMLEVLDSAIPQSN